uniref:C-type lectin domain family 4 member C n=2 Tax=Ciona intestinalis TaxID=7719 RepID=F6PJP0_CIOIN
MLFISVMLLLLLNNAFAEKLKFQRGTTEDFSYSLTSSKAKLTVGLMTCFSSPPKNAAVTLVRPTDASLQHRFKAKVLQIFSDSLSIELERVDVHSSWEWIELKIEWIVYLENAGSDWFEASNGLLYKYIPIRMSYEKAKTECKKLGAWVVVHASTNETVLTQMHNELVPAIKLRYWVG